MRRRLFNLLALGSLLMLGIVVLFWVKSYLWRDYLNFHRVSGSLLIDSNNGEIELVKIPLIYFDNSPLPSVDGSFWPFEGGTASYAGPAVSAKRIFGFHFERWYSNSSWIGNGWALTVPYWFPALIFSILPLIFFYRRIRKRNRNPFACISCGYDLRATPDRCPECGAVVDRIS